MLDLRKPAGFFFLLLGALLAVYGVAADAKAPLLDMNLNLYFGVFSILFGGLFLWLSRKA
ncbi:MAG TPA: hypothetical protein PKJ41_19380 [Bryobacteraceae bacterium]|nr:hypothetical protein [Bryobacteraceae bacterium]HPT29146.1 hypothetical protein [Bryobacteraceae bacterium]